MSADIPPAREAASGTDTRDGREFVLGALPQSFGKFVLRRRLARGGMADVYLASLSGAEGFEKELVVKLIRQELSADEAFVRRFVEEAKTCVRLTHPNIVSIFELGVEAGVLYMAMELVRGATLAELLAEGGALRSDEGCYLALEVARALDHAHKRNVVHRDVTPGNVMIDENGAVKLLDFGIAAKVGGLDAEVFGTPGHMPPEQMEGLRLSPSADLFALATVVVEAWTGRPPYRRADARASKSALLEGTPLLVSDTIEELAPLDDLVRSSLDRDPARRPQHAEDVARVLRKHLRERNIDLDEVARGIAQRVSRAMTAREDHERGAKVKGPPMQQAMRPTPYAEATRTFATRGGLDTWSGPSTRRIDDDPPTPAAAPMEATKVEATEVAREVAAPRRALNAPLLMVIALVASGVAVFALTRGSTTIPTVPTAPSVAGSVSVSAAAPTSSGSAGSSATTTAPSLSATVPQVPSTSASTAPTGGKLVVASSPPALVEIDGVPKGKTPISITVALGEHRIVLRPQGLGESFERRVTVTATGGIELRGDFNDEPSISIRKLPTAPPPR